ncbi:MAG: alpha-hydroxy-acid oxidizing protein, partial [Sulfuricaulis sp.]|nr:alpha-hydroxy-acid oxidizing protein [Sulfuricaulis sp.]
MSNLRPEPSEPVAAANQVTPARVHAAARPDKASPRVLRSMLALDDFEAPARRYIPRPIFGYISGGAETNASMRGNRAAFDDLAFVPKALVDVRGRTQKTTLFGRTYDAPFGIAPMGGTAMAAYQGDLVLARAAAAANIPMVLSGASLTPLDRVAET